MEPFDRDELTDQELEALLPEWKVPRAPARLRASVFPDEARPWWKRFWTVSIRIPLPAAVSLGLVLGAAAWRWPVSRPPQIIVRTERVEVPVVKERVVMVHAASTHRARNHNRLEPVAELRPVVIRSGE